MFLTGLYWSIHKLAAALEGGLVPLFFCMFGFCFCFMVKVRSLTIVVFITAWQWQGSYECWTICSKAREDLRSALFQPNKNEICSPTNCSYVRPWGQDSGILSLMYAVTFVFWVSENYGLKYLTIIIIFIAHIDSGQTTLLFPKFFLYNLTLVMQLLLSGGKEVRERYSGAVEAFSRRNPTSPRGDHTKHRTYEDVPIHKDVVNTFSSNN